MAVQMGWDSMRILAWGEDWRALVRARIAYLRSVRPGGRRFSQRVLAERAELTEPDVTRYLKAPGTRSARRLPIDCARRIGLALELEPDDQARLVDLVRLEAAIDAETNALERKGKALDRSAESHSRVAAEGVEAADRAASAAAIEQRVIRARLTADAARRREPLDSRATEGPDGYVGSWLRVTIREMVPLPGFRPDAGWIADHIVFKGVTPEQVDKAWKDLCDSGLVELNDAGRWQQRDAVVTLGHEARVAAAKVYHKQVLSQIKVAIDDVTSEWRMLNALTVRASRKRLPALRERLVNLINDFADETTDEEADTIYQIHASLIPLAEVGDAPGVRRSRRG